MGTAGKSYITSFFREQAQLNFILANARTSIMSFLHGSVTSGSAAGISMHGKVRLASPNVQFSMPECRLGYVPDGGSTYLLSRLPGLLGWYLLCSVFFVSQNVAESRIDCCDRYIALTGHTLNSGDLLYSGLATHAIALDDFTALQQILMASEYDDHMEMNMNLHFPQPVCTSHSWFCSLCLSS
jgi:enoyl-CoA hydratase/carnithine racemase